MNVDDFSRLLEQYGQACILESRPGGMPPTPGESAAALKARIVGEWQRLRGPSGGDWDSGVVDASGRVRFPRTSRDPFLHDDVEPDDQGFYTELDDPPAGNGPRH
jgi:hypothetical protein